MENNLGEGTSFRGNTSFEGPEEKSFFGYCFVAVTLWHFVTHLLVRSPKFQNVEPNTIRARDLITRWSSKKSDIMWSLDALSSSSFWWIETRGKLHSKRTR